MALNKKMCLDYESLSLPEKSISRWNGYNITFSPFFLINVDKKSIILNFSIEKHFADPTYYSTNNLINISLSFSDKD